MARPRPRCPFCDLAVPRARLVCPGCDRALVDPAVADSFEVRAGQLARDLHRRPWLRDGRALPYVQRSLERGFLRRRSSAPDPDLQAFLDDLEHRLDALPRRLLLEHLVATVVRENSRPLAAYLTRLLTTDSFGAAKSSE